MSVANNEPSSEPAPVLTYENTRGHGSHDNTTTVSRFGRMFPSTSQHPVVLKLETCQAVGERMTALAEESRGDSITPAGYTYFGQFVDHDISRDITVEEADDPNTAQIEPTPIEQLQQGRSPTLDLDSLYGSSQSRNERFFTGAKFKIGKTTATPIGTGPVNQELRYDLPRKMEVKPGKVARVANIGDPRNDENLAVAQIHLMWLKFHNHVVDAIKAKQPGASDGMLFEHARELVTRHYQYVVLHDFVKRYIQEDVYNEVVVSGKRKFLMQGCGEVAFMPLEFSVAAYRHGHSQVRETYDWNVNFGPTGTLAPSPFQLLFEFSEISGNFRNNPSLPSNWIVDFRRLFDFGGQEFEHLKGSKKGSLNFTKKIDPYIAGALADLPEVRAMVEMGKLPFGNLAALNLRRSSMRGLPSGQDVSRLLTDVRMLTKSQIDSIIDEEFQAVMQAHGLYDRTPLWLYLLFEAAVHADGNRLGKMGSIITAETFMSLLVTSRNSILRPGAEWEPSDALEVLGNESFGALDSIPKILSWMDIRDPIIDPLQDKRLAPVALAMDSAPIA